MKDRSRNTKRAEHKDGKSHKKFGQQFNINNLKNHNLIKRASGVIDVTKSRTLTITSGITKVSGINKLKRANGSEKENINIKKHDPRTMTELGSLKKKFGFNWKKALRSFLFISLGFGILSIVGLAIAAVFLVNAYVAAPVITEDLLQAGENSVVYMRDGKTELFRFSGVENRENVELKNIPIGMQYAVIGLEDENFYKVSGVSWWNVGGALASCVVKLGKGCRGASGLAQQLYRNVLGDKDQTTDRKVRELFSAQKLYEKKSKEQVLELYLNWVSYGGNINGVQVAAKKYFGKDISATDLSEQCLIASMPQSPSAYFDGIYKGKDKPESEYYKLWKLLEERKDTCLEKMYKLDLKGDGVKLIKTKDELTTWQKKEVKFIEPRSDRKYPHWEEYVRSELLKILPLEDWNKDGYKVITSLDPVIQDNVQNITATKFEAVRGGNLNNAASVVLEGGTGYIAAMVGSLDYNNKEIDGQVNIVTSSDGQAPGSTFKPYDYTTAFRKGFNPSTVLLDAVTDFGGGYKPQNFSKGTQGLMTMAYGLQNSLNIPAIKAAIFGAGEGVLDYKKSMGEVQDTMTRMGAKFADRCTEGDKNLEIVSAIGSCDIIMLSHATAFATLSQDGTLHTPRGIISITANPSRVGEDKVAALNEQLDGKLKELYPVKEGSLEPEIARQMNSVLSDNVLRGFAKTDSGLHIPGWLNKIGAKTGTSTVGEKNEAANLWTVGYSKKYTVAVWAGNTQKPGVGCTACNYIGETVALPIWNDIMRSVHGGIDPNDPSNTFSVEGLAKSNALCPSGIPGGSRCATEWMSPSQIEKIKLFRDKIAKPDFDIAKLNIFDFRNEGWSIKRWINKIDGKVIDQTKWIDYPTLIEEKECVIVPTAFPQYWKSTAGNLGDPNCIESSKLDPTKQGLILTTTPALTNGSIVPSNITISGGSDNTDIKITKIEVRIDGVLIDSDTTGNFVWKASDSGYNGSHTLNITMTDSFGRTKDLTYQAMAFNFTAKELLTSELSSLSIVCSPSTITTLQTTTCKFTLPASRKYPINDIYIQIGSSTPYICSDTNQLVTCTLSGFGNPLGSYPIKLRIGNAGLSIQMTNIIIIQ
jgi:membrane peptidoglycan carboxypeptidase